MLIREYQSEDFEKIILLMSGKYPQRRKSQLKMVENCESFSCFVAEDKNEIKGFVIFEDLGDNKSFYLVQISVIDKRQGIGTQLMRKVFEKVDTGSQVILNVNTANKGAIKFYKKLGFKKSGFTKDYRQAEDKYWFKIDL